MENQEELTEGDKVYDRSNKLAIGLLRAVLVMTIAYPVVAAFSTPIAWMGFVPLWIGQFIDRKVFLLIFNIFESLLVIWLIWGRKLYYAAIISAVLMFAIVIVNLVSFEIVFRDIGLGLAALALAVLVKNNLRHN